MIEYWNENWPYSEQIVKTIIAVFIPNPEIGKSKAKNAKLGIEYKSEKNEEDAEWIKMN